MRLFEINRIAAKLGKNIPDLYCTYVPVGVNEFTSQGLEIFDPREPRVLVYNI